MLLQMKSNRKFAINVFFNQPISSTQTTIFQEQEVIFAVRALPLMLRINCRPTPPAIGSAGHSLIVPTWTDVPHFLGHKFRQHFAAIRNQRTICIH